MLIPFRSKAAGEFYMMDNHVQLLFALMGKTFASEGIIQADEISMRLTQLQSALANSTENLQHDISSSDNPADAQAQSEKKNVDVVWGSSV
jgi:Domain of unknown function (DUF1840)